MIPPVWIESFSAFAGTLPEALLLLDDEATVLEANRTAARILDRPRDDLVGCSLLSLAADRSEAEAYWKRCRGSGQLIPGVLEVRTGDDETSRRLRCDGGVVLPPHRSDDGAVTLLRLRSLTASTVRFRLLQERIDQLHREVRHRREAERKLEKLLEAEQEARRMAAEAARLKDEFLASLSHELRTPLNVLLGWIDILQDRNDASDLLEQALPAMEKAVRRETELVEDLLDVQRIVTGRLRLEIEQVDLGPLVTDVVTGFETAATSRGVELSLEVTPELPAVYGDRSRIRQVVWNLVSNAVKFTEEGDRIRISVSGDGDAVEVTVSDTGAGIAPDEIPFVFDHFRQAGEFPREGYGGLGLGLALVRHLMDLHGGEARAASPGEGEGSTFAVSFPVAHDSPLDTLTEPVSSDGVSDADSAEA